MQKDFTESWGKLCQALCKPWTEIAELNVTTLSNCAKTTCNFEEAAQAKRPEEVLAAQTKCANNVCLATTRYVQQAMDIGLNAVTEASKIWGDICRQSTNQACDISKSSTATRGAGITG